MNADGLTFLVLAAAAVGLAVWFHRKRTQSVSDEQLREWLSFITKSNGRPASARLNAYDYDSIRLLFHPSLRAEYEEKLTRLDNEFSARAIETALVIRRQAKGLPMSDADDRVLIREGLRRQSAGQSDRGELEFTPGKFRKDNEPTTEDQSET